MNSSDNDRAPVFSGNRAKSTLTAFYDSRSKAEAAIDKLRAAGVADVRLMPGYEADTDGAPAPEHATFWAGLEDWLFPDDDRNVYAEGLRRGGLLVSASVDDATYDTAHGILDEEGAIDMDERADLWRAEGWGSPDQTTIASRDEVFQANVAAGAATGVGRYTRNLGSPSPRVRSYDLTRDLPDDVVDDIVPTGHQRDVSEGDRRAEGGLSQSQSIDDLRQKQSFPGGR
ncbi:hypothetical protein ATY81_00015 [Rhizobium sp. R72]|uniref:hypothetical protein n=1 Tax=unclassified Rhizobium TaxID=2613769 RepID=UPI000B536368|nr:MULTISPECIES: hypothetical protein [unclassified Rhizobium]OWW04431.1 hypothetical protein ATY81_00015 [Rhizobium sp. R72]OWW05488.1 hypothetical protein ATY80_00015 [Rhizobium sp. R711]